ncbi:hypothetical protein ig2599ANME_0531 [groundwater metagenome]
MSTLELGLGIFATVLALVPIIVYIIVRFCYRPNISLKISGEQSGKPIPLPSYEGNFMLGFTTNLKKDVVIEEVRIDFNPEQLKLFEDKKAVTYAWYAVAEKGTGQLEIREQISDDILPHPQEYNAAEFPSLNNVFPITLRLSESPIISRDYIKLYAFKYKCKDNLDEFQIKVHVYFKLQDYELEFPWDMFIPKTQRHSEVLNFRIEQNFKGDSRQRLLRYGFPHEPRKTIMLGETLEKTHSTY